MKKNLSIIYRLAFVLFSVWAILESVSFRLAELPVKLLSFTTFSATICMLCILLVLLRSMRYGVGKALLFFKNCCTFLAILTLAANFSMLFSVENSGWVLSILLPLMMFLDYLFFDVHGKLKLWQMLLALLCAILLVVALYATAKYLLHLPNALDFLALLPRDKSLKELILNTLLLTGLAYLLDGLFSGAFFKDIKSLFSLLLKVLFLLLEAWAFTRLSGMNLKTFIFSLRYYEVFINFLSYLCIAAILIYNVLHFKATAKNAPKFSRIKTFFTLGLFMAFVVYHFYVRGNYNPGRVETALYYVAPAILLLDWLFFDTHNRIYGYDPLIWSGIATLYFSVVILLGKVGYANLYPIILNGNIYAFLGVFVVTMTAVGYIFYLTNRFIKGR